MAQNGDVTLTAGAWTQLTDADVSAITFVNRSEYSILVKATTDTTTPTTFAGAVPYGPSMGEANKSMSDLFPGLSGADRLWAYCEYAATVMVSHA